MKRLLAALLAAAMIIASGVPAFAAKKVYTTETKKTTVSAEGAPSVRATLTVPGYLGSLSATLNTAEGSGDFDVIVVYVPSDKWDEESYYSGITATVRGGGCAVYPAYEDIIKWDEYYSSGFLPTSGGIYILDSTSLQMNFLEGPGLYTALASFFYSPKDYGFSSADELAAKYGYADAGSMLAAGRSEIGASAVGFPFVLILDDDMISYFLKNGRLDSHSSYSWPGLKELLEEHEYKPAEGSGGDEGFANFTGRKSYYKGIFLDVGFDAPAWYDSYAETTYRLGLMQGMDGKFNPGGNLTIAQALAMACRVHNIYRGDSGDFTQNPRNWYSVYVNYAVENGIITAYDFNAYRDPTAYGRTCTRAEMAYIFARCLPAEALDISNVVNSIPDVKITTPYRNEIFTLYRAGIVEGSDRQHSFRPSSYITRAEAAAIISRMAIPSMRKSFVIE